MFMGFLDDMILNCNLKPWLLEVNVLPGETNRWRQTSKQTGRKNGEGAKQL